MSYFKLLKAEGVYEPHWSPPPGVDQDVLAPSLMSPKVQTVLAEMENQSENLAAD